MSYATSDDLVAAFGLPQLLLIADRDGDQEPDAAVVDKVLADASGIVDLHLRGLYALPLSPVPAEIVPIVCDLARRMLYGNATEVPDSVLSADKAARDLLRLMANGTLKLAAPAATGEADAGPGLEAEILGDTPTFTKDSLKGF